MRPNKLLFIVFIISITITCQAVAQSEELTVEQSELKVLERRVIKLELLMAELRSFSAHLADPQFELELESMVDQVVEAEPEKNNIWGSVILIGALIFLVIGIAVLTIRLSRR